jgi:hypothetical protein
MLFFCPGARGLCEEIKLFSAKIKFISPHPVFLLTLTPALSQRERGSRDVTVLREGTFFSATREY